jgi:hypothetical protein
MDNVFVALIYTLIGTVPATIFLFDDWIRIISFEENVLTGTKSWNLAIVFSCHNMELLVTLSFIMFF